MRNCFIVLILNIDYLDLLLKLHYTTLSEGHIVIPYTQGLVEIVKKISSKYGIQTHFRENRTLKLLLVKHKDQEPIDKKSGVIYMYHCGTCV